jgi:hypothetical protein
MAEARNAGSRTDIIANWYFQSSSNPAKRYETLKFSDGSTSCNCPGWCMKKGEFRTCKHTRMVDAGVADRECVGGSHTHQETAPVASTKFTAKTGKVEVMEKERKIAKVRR